jgi:hypothetical protein
MPARKLCLKVNLKIRGVDFIANLIVLELKGIDITLGLTNAQGTYRLRQEIYQVDYSRRKGNGTHYQGCC